ncbi:MAG: OmpA family protein, partial [Bacteroidales bacterium]
YRGRSHKESGAPVLTYFYLGRAYHLDNQYDAAVRNYERYLEAGKDEEPIQLEYAQMQIEACRRAREIVRNPPSFEFYSVFDRFDDELPSSSNPVISGNGDILIFLVDYPSDRKIVMSTRKEGVWSRPRVINSELGMVGETYPVSLSYDGEELYIVHHYYSHSDILVSRFENGRWTEAESLNRHINGRTSETHASISRDGNTLYFTSDRRGGMGSYDIYVSRRDADGDWGPPTNLGPVINTPYEEHTPFISSNDSILFFSSQGHGSIGGIDVFLSELSGEGKWSEPENVGYPVNSTGEDVFFNPGWGESDGYYAVRRPSDPTTNTINMVIELEPEEQTAMMQPPQDMSVDSGVSARVPESSGEKAPTGTDAPTSIEEAIEPPVTDEIQEIMNRNQQTTVPSEMTASAGTTASAATAAPAATTAAPAATSASAATAAPAATTATPAATSAGPATFTLVTGVPFDYDDHSLNMEAWIQIEKILDVMREHPGIRITVNGHTDSRGSSQYNMLLSLQRADRIAQYLIDMGIDQGRVEVSGSGETAPVACNRHPDGTDAPLGRYLNRHVTVAMEQVPTEIRTLAEFYVPSSLRPDPVQAEKVPEGSGRLTVQVIATSRPLNISHFRNLDIVKEHVCRDGIYRYTSGLFSRYSLAKERLEELRRSGYADAFMRTVEWYGKAAVSEMADKD